MSIEADNVDLIHARVVCNIVMFNDITCGQVSIGLAPDVAGLVHKLALRPFWGTFDEIVLPTELLLSDLYSFSK